MMDFDMFDVSPERLRAVRNLLRDELTDQQRTMLLTAVLAPILSDEQIALVVSGTKALDEAYNRAAQKLNISE